MDLAAQLEAFDGKHTEVLEQLACRLRPSTQVIDELCEVARSDADRLQVASTWVLKRFQGEGATFSERQVEGLVCLLGQVRAWEARLHLLQMLPGLVIPASQTAAVDGLLNRFLDERNKLVRAWSYNGLHVLATQYPGFREEVATILRKGQEDEAASVRARVRNLLKTTTWGDSSEPH